MVDYQSHVAGLQILENELSSILASSASNPALKNINNALQSNRGLAVLGSLIDHLFEHAGDSDREIQLLTEASTIWSKVIDMLNQVAQIRQQLESLVLDPSQTDLVNKFNAVSIALKNLKPAFLDLTARLQGFYAELQLLDHLKAHGQELDQPVIDWTWKDIVLSRRSGAFVHNLVRIAEKDGSKESVAFAYGAISSYATNVTGSAYLNQVVGGPRRAHLIRDRVAEYSVGAWLRAHQPNLTLPLPSLRALLTFGPPHDPHLPKKIAQLIDKAIQETYGGKLGAHPNLETAYNKLIKHLDLLNAFPMPPVPQPINSTLWTKVMTLHPDDVSGGAAPPANDTGSATPSSGSSISDIPWWAWVLFAVCVALVALCYFTGICSSGNTNPFPDPTTNDPQGTGTAQSYLTSDDAYIEVSLIFNMHLAVWQLAVYGLKTMKLLGLVYPEASDLGEVQFSQFITIPGLPLSALKRPISDPNLFLKFPVSAAENPVANIAPYPPVANPLAFLFGVGGSMGASAYGITLWNAESMGGMDSDLKRTNRNLDADRGFEHECWAVKSGSISVDPVPVKILAYTDI